jgi:hypothetical protein
LLGHWIVSQHFIEPEGSILNSQELSACPYPEPNESNPTSPGSIHLRLGLPNGPFPSNNPYVLRLSPIRATCIAHLILLDLIILLFMAMTIKSITI